MKQLHLIYIVAVALLLAGFQPADNKFTLAEQQQISIETPGLFTRSDAFTINLGDIASDEYSFPLPVGKAALQDEVCRNRSFGAKDARPRQRDCDSACQRLGNGV